MNMDQAIREVEAGHCERIASPGQWKVWRDGNEVKVEVL